MDPCNLLQKGTASPRQVPIQETHMWHVCSGSRFCSVALLWPHPLIKVCPQCSLFRDWGIGMTKLGTRVIRVLPVVHGKTKAKHTYFGTTHAHFSYTHTAHRLSEAPPFSPRQETPLKQLSPRLWLLTELSSDAWMGPTPWGFAVGGTVTQAPECGPVSLWRTLRWQYTLHPLLPSHLPVPSSSCQSPLCHQSLPCTEHHIAGTGDAGEPQRGQINTYTKPARSRVHILPMGSRTKRRELDWP